jgi:hypothetical protein
MSATKPEIGKQTEIPRCSCCGYTEEDAKFNMDHHLCRDAGNAPWEAEHSPQPPAPCGHEEASSIFCPICDTRPTHAESYAADLDQIRKELPPTVDVERELYLALKEITKNVQPPHGKCECPMCKGFAAIKLYEQKGKL